MKRILYITTSNIYVRTGGGIANLALLNSLSKDFQDNIDILIYEEAIKGRENTSNCIGVPSISGIKKIKNICLGRIHRFSPWLKKFLKSNASKYSHCFINSGILGEYVNILKEYGIKVAVIHHNYEPEFQLDNRRPSTFFGLSSFLVKKSEQKSYENSDLNFFLSEDDRRRFNRIYKRKAPEYTIGIFEPASSGYQELRGINLNPSKLAICGSLNSIQTIIGLKNFFENYFSLLQNYYKNQFTLKIAGRNPGKKIISLHSDYPQIEVIPNPPVMSEVVKDCGIFICPTNVGGGIKLRIIDGLKLGMPILTHSVSARGYNQLHNYPWFQSYSNQKSFMEGLNKIVLEIGNNPNLRSEILDVYDNLFSYEHGDRIFRRVSNDFILS